MKNLILVGLLLIGGYTFADSENANFQEIVADNSGPSCSIGANTFECAGFHYSDGGCSVSCNAGQYPKCEPAFCQGTQLKASICHCQNYP